MERKGRKRNGKIRKNKENKKGKGKEKKIKKWIGKAKLKKI